MCGIVGYFSTTTEPDDNLVRRMAANIAHRGPDDVGAWIDKEAGLALAHRRLSIHDLSSAGHQPMQSADERLVLIYNGEIYNHKELRAEVEATGWNQPWAGHSDTETLLAALQIWGVEKTLVKCNGMFAFALWDRKRRVLSMARDRFGEKPLYYGNVGNSFLFSSELKALKLHPDWQGEIDRDALGLYFRYAYVPDPWSIYQDIYKLAPAHWIEIENGKAGTPKCYWDLEDVTSFKRQSLSKTNENLEELHARLLDATELRMGADVPLGAFLSGGIDSSLIVALMQARSNNPVKSFTIGFDVPGYNEAENAKEVADHLGTDHTELYLDPQDALDVIPDLPEIWDEPFADSSQIPTLLLSKLTREHVTVALSGDAGDEVFGGYNRYGAGYALHQKLGKLPNALKSVTASLLRTLPADKVAQLMQLLPSRLQPTKISSVRLEKLASVLSHAGDSEYYLDLVSQFADSSTIVLGSTAKQTILSDPNHWPKLDDFRDTMMYLDSMSYLPGDILTKVDRATMSVSLESRIPFLDHELVEFAWTLPVEMKIKDGQTKWPLRQILEKYVPRKLIERPKMGFGVPIEHWLRGPLKSWANELLNPERVEREGYLDSSKVTWMWEEYQNGNRAWHHKMWTILMFQAWLEKQ